EVDAAVAGLNARVRAATEQVTLLKQNQRRASAAVSQSREKADRLESELAAATAQRQEALERLETEVAAAAARDRDAVARLEAELAAVQAKLSNTEHRVQALTEELVSATEESASPNRPQFE